MGMSLTKRNSFFVIALEWNRILTFLPSAGLVYIFSATFSVKLTNAYHPIVLCPSANVSESLQFSF